VAGILLGVAGAVVLLGLVTGQDWAPVGIVALLLLALLLRVEMIARRAQRREARQARREAATRESLRDMRSTLSAQAHSIKSMSVAVDGAATSRGISESLRVGSPLDVRLRHEFDQIQATVNLFALVQPAGRIPAMRGWAASPDVLVLVLDELLSRRPRLVVECGSGVSTLWMALAIRQHAIPCRIVSLDHDEPFLEATRETLRRHGVADVVDLRLAPLVASGIPGHETPWYDMTALDDLADVDLAFVDGPPGVTGAAARYPALPALHGRMSRDAVLILDDAARDDEIDTVARWVSEFPDVRAQAVPLEKGAAIIRRVLPA
jgi:predicted O-methyltransferase YrrM